MFVEAFEILGQFMSFSLPMGVNVFGGIAVLAWICCTNTVMFYLATMVNHHFSTAFRRFCLYNFSKSKSMMFNGTLMASETSLSHGVTRFQ